MKNTILRQSLLFLFCLLTSDFLLLAQAPQGIPYQAIARNASGVAIANTAVKVRFSIRDSIATGAIKYQETHNPTTSALGLFSVNVGMGIVVSGTLSGINWGKNAKFLQVELDPAGGANFTDLGTTQMMSVPYALFSGGTKFNVSLTGDTLFTGSGNFLIIPGVSLANPSTERVIDIDGNIYDIVKIGSQYWMKSNLKTTRYSNGDPIIFNLSNSDWNATGTGAWCNYKNFAPYNDSFGKLYNWFATTDSRGLCPVGWGVPTDGDWKIMESQLGMSASELDISGYRGSGNVGGKLKSESGWFNNGNGTNEIGFNGFPGGNRVLDFIGIGQLGAWWTSTGSGPSGWYRYVDYSGGHVARYLEGKISGFYIRCIKK